MAKLKRRIVLAAMTLAQALVVRAEAPTVTSVEPAQVFADEATTVTIRGAGFSTDSRVGLLDASGPHIVAVVPTPGSAQDVAVEGDLAYVADGNGLVVVDVADPSRPRVLSRLPLDDASRVVGLGQVVLVGGSRTLSVIDLSSPSLPVLAATLDLGPASFWGLEAVDGYAYAFSRPELLVIDVRDPRAPFVARRMDGVTTGYGFTLARAGDILYVQEINRDPLESRVLHTIDIADRLNPVFRRRGFRLGEWSRWVHVLDSAVSGGTLYTALRNGYHDWVEVVDVRNPNSPSRIAAIEDRSGSLAAEETSLFVAEDGAIIRYDVTDPANPGVIGRCVKVTSDSPLFPTSRLAVARGHLFATPSLAGSADLAIVDFTRLGPVAARLGRFDSPSGLAWFQMAGDDVAAFHGGLIRDGLSLVDLKDPSRPSVVGNTALRGYRYGPVAFSDSLQIVLSRFCCEGGEWGPTEWEEIDVVDLREPSQPRVARSIRLNHDLDRVLAAGNRAYIVGGDPLVRAAVDLDAPSWNWGWQPDYPRFQQVWVRAADDRFLYANGLEFENDRWIPRLLVLDTSRSESDAIVASVDLPSGPSWGMTLNDGLLYLLFDEDTRVVYDVRHPARPVLVADPLAPWIPPSVVVTGGRAIDPTTDELRVLDMRDPMRPWVSASFPPPAADLTRPFVPRLSGPSIRSDRVVQPDIAGFTIFRLPPRLDPPGALSSEEIRLDVPASYTPGTYHVRVTNGEPEAGVLYAALRVCARKPFDATLSPVSLPTAPVRPLDPIRWRLALDGDPAFFGDPPGHRASLALPPLPATLTTRFEPGDGSGRMSIEILVGTGADLGEVVLTGDDRAAIEALWSAIRDASGISLSPLDDRRYGDMTLEVHEGNAWANAAGAPRGPAGAPSPAAHPGPVRRYLYEFAGGRLDAARAWGPGVDLIFEAEAVDGERCEFSATASFREARRAPCEGLGAAQRSERAAVCGS